MKLVGSAGCDIQECLTLQSTCEALTVSTKPDTAVYVGQVQDGVGIPGHSLRFLGVMECLNDQQV